MTLGGTENMAMSAVEGAIGPSIGLLITWAWHVRPVGR